MSLLERAWERATPLWPLISAALLPLSVLFALVAGVRRSAFRAGWLRAERLAVPVIVVGNLTVGGTGKTPLVLWLAEKLRERGFSPGILSRGYRSSSAGSVAVTPRSSATDVGDEPLLLARASGCPVWIGVDRVDAGRRLLGVHPHCDVLIADDGLQHYRLARDVEIAVVDGERGHGNGLLLPAGPLREPVSRLQALDAVVLNTVPGKDPDRRLGAGRPAFAMHLAVERLRNVAEPMRAEQLLVFRGRPVHAVAGIGNPQRFFAQLLGHGLDVTAHPFPDHYRYRAEDLDFGDGAAVLMTEKDAVKCERFARPNWWALVVRAELEPGLDDLVVARLKRP
jgi:tetraacyldisaccharide 4'-kinase